MKTSTSKGRLQVGLASLAAMLVSALAFFVDVAVTAWLMHLLENASNERNYENRTDPWFPDFDLLIAGAGILVLFALGVLLAWVICAVASTLAVRWTVAPGLRLVSGVVLTATISMWLPMALAFYQGVVEGGVYAWTALAGAVVTLGIPVTATMATAGQLRPAPVAVLVAAALLLAATCVVPGQIG